MERLTLGELYAIEQRRKDDPDVQLLLGEMRMLRAEAMSFERQLTQCLRRERGEDEPPSPPYASVRFPL